MPGIHQNGRLHLLLSPQSGSHGGPPQGKPARQLSSLGLLVACFFSWFVDVFRARCPYVFHVCVFVFGAFSESILGACWVVFGAFGRRFLDLGRGSSEDALSGAFLEANLAPTWSQVGAQVGAKLRSKSPSKLVIFLTLYLKGICSILGSVLEGFGAPKWSPKANLR